MSKFAKSVMLALAGSRKMEFKLITDHRTVEEIGGQGSYACGSEALLRIEKQTSRDKPDSMCRQLGVFWECEGSPPHGVEAFIVVLAVEGSLLGTTMSKNRVPRTRHCLGHPVSKKSLALSHPMGR